MGNWGTTTSRIAHNQAEAEHSERLHQQQQHSMDQYGSGGGVYPSGSNVTNRQGPAVGQPYPSNQFARANPNVSANYNNKPKNTGYSGSTAGGGSGRSKYNSGGGGGGHPHMNHSSSSNYQQYHNQYHENNGATYTVPSIVKEKDFNHLDDLINNSGGQSIESHNYRRALEPLSNGRRGTDSTADYENGGGEENWAYISQNVDYNEKIQFLDDEDDEQAPVEVINEAKSCVESQVSEEVVKQTHTKGELDEEPASWDQKRKYNECSEDLKKSIERARLRRAEEERRLSEQRQAVCAEKLRQLNLKKATAPVTAIEQQQQSVVEPVAQTEAPQVPGYPIRPPPSDLLFVAKPANESLVKPLMDSEEHSVRDESKSGRVNLSTGPAIRNNKSPQFNQNITARGGQRHNFNQKNR